VALRHHTWELVEAALKDINAIGLTSPTLPRLQGCSVGRFIVRRIKVKSIMPMSLRVFVFIGFMTSLLIVTSGSGQANLADRVRSTQYGEFMEMGVLAVGHCR